MDAETAKRRVGARPNNLLVAVAIAGGALFLLGVLLRKDPDAIVRMSSTAHATPPLVSALEPEQMLSPAQGVLLAVREQAQAAQAQAAQASEQAAQLPAEPQAVPADPVPARPQSQSPQQQQQPANTGASAARPQLRVALLMLIVDRFPPWWPFLVSSYRLNAPEFTLVAIHTGERPPPLPAALGEAAVRYVHIPLPQLAERFATKLGATAAQASAKFASGKGLSDLKPFYGQVFEDEIAGYSHWGWVDWDILLGDLRSVIGVERLWEWDAVTLGGATLGFAWAGQLTVFQNSQETRQLYRLADDHLALGFKAHGDGQSGWEERTFLRDVLKRRPGFSIHFHMGAQMDYKAQWLTWVPFDHYWHKGRVWRCARGALGVEGRPPLLLENASAWHEDVALIQTAPKSFYERKKRVCIRWDLSASPWMCCPHSMGVGYRWRAAKLSGEEMPYRTADAVVLQARVLGRALGDDEGD